MQDKDRQFEKYMAAMQAPIERQQCTETNCLWLLRNGAVLYRNHKDIEKAIGAAKAVLRKE